ncbi:hypothetical protein COCC4DRAFT_33063, partial [Bipolaris maydis ATCC 48331]
MVSIGLAFLLLLLLATSSGLVIGLLQSPAAPLHFFPSPTVLISSTKAGCRYVLPIITRI